MKIIKLQEKLPQCKLILHNNRKITKPNDPLKSKFSMAPISKSNTLNSLSLPELRLIAILSTSSNRYLLHQMTVS